MSRPTGTTVMNVIHWHSLLADRRYRANACNQDNSTHPQSAIHDLTSKISQLMYVPLYSIAAVQKRPEKYRPTVDQ